MKLEWQERNRVFVCLFVFFAHFLHRGSTVFGQNTPQRNLETRFQFDPKLQKHKDRMIERLFWLTPLTMVE